MNCYEPMTLNIAPLAKPNVRQFALHFNLPNLMFAKYTVCTVNSQTPHITSYLTNHIAHMITQWWPVSHNNS